jgi:uncharacterized protein YkwD
MRSPLIAALSLALFCMALFGAAPASFATPSATTTTTIYLPLMQTVDTWPQTAEQRAMAEQVLAVVNAERLAAGCGPLTLNAQLTAAAQTHSEDMARNDFFGHLGSDGSRSVQRAGLAGYGGQAGWENVAAGYSSAEDVVRGWMTSTSGHRENILDCRLSEMGLGYVFETDDRYPGPYGYRHYWTQTFGIP